MLEEKARISVSEITAAGRENRQPPRQKQERSVEKRMVQRILRCYMAMDTAQKRSFISLVDAALLQQQPPEPPAGICPASEAFPPEP